MSQEMQWKTVSDDSSEAEEIKMTFDKIGDNFSGEFLGTRVIEPADPTEKPYTQARFAWDGEVYFTNMGYSLRKGLKDVRKGAMVRLTYVSDLDTGQASPMKQFKVEVAVPVKPQVSRSQNT